MAYLIFWEFRPNPEKEAEFRVVYGPHGEWARFFRRSYQFLGTELLRDESDPQRYVTVDRWVSRQAFEAFRRQYEAEYFDLDRRCEALNAREIPLGAYETIENGKAPAP
jgi:heme-degrading monooxygenase HmoA